VVDALAAGDGELPAGDGLSPDGEGLSPDGDGLSPDGEGLPAKAHTLSAVVEPALLSTSVVALHMVQFEQVFWFVAVANRPLGHATQVRSVLPVPLVDIFWPAMQLDHKVQENALAEAEYVPAPQDEHIRSDELVPFVAMRWPAVQFAHGVHESSLAVAEYAPAPQGVHTRSVILVPFEETYFPAVHEVHAEHDRGVDGGNKDSVTSVTSCAFPNSPVGHPVPQRTPSFVLVCAVHVPAKGETVQGLEVQFVGLTYLSAPPLLPSYP
jgi:hypothetical protein